jgi:hypothetical protein
MGRYTARLVEPPKGRLPQTKVSLPVVRSAGKHRSPTRGRFAHSDSPFVVQAEGTCPSPSGWLGSRYGGFHDQAHRLDIRFGHGAHARCGAGAELRLPGNACSRNARPPPHAYAAGSPPPSDGAGRWLPGNRAGRWIPGAVAVFWIPDDGAGRRTDAARERGSPCDFPGPGRLQQDHVHVPGGRRLLIEMALRRLKAPIRAPSWDE